MAQRPRSFLPIPFNGWALLRADYLDATYGPGLLTNVMRARGAMRHSCFAALESFSLQVVGQRRQAQDGETEHLQKIAALMMAPSANNLMEAFRHGKPVPHGYLALLARLGSDPLPFGFYVRLATCFERRDQRARLLERIGGEISRGMIEAALELEECALIPRFVAGTSKTKPDAMNEAIKRLRLVCSDLSDQGISQSLGDVAMPFDLEAWFEETVLRRMDTPPAPHPISENDPDFQPLISGPEIAASGRRLQNCLRGRILLAASGKAAFFVSKNDIAFEARRLSIPPFWVVSEMLGAGNRSLTVSEWNWAIEALAARGIPVLVNMDRGGDQLLQKIGHCDFGCGVEPPATDDVKPTEAEAA